MKFFNFKVFKIENQFSENVKIDREKLITEKNLKNIFLYVRFIKKIENRFKIGITSVKP